MNYYAARQHSATKKWHYTVLNGAQIDAVGACVDDGGHTTEPEACACYRAYLAGAAKFQKLPKPGKGVATWTCDAPGCDEPATAEAEVLMRRFHLCEDHADAAVLLDLAPEVGTIVSSY